jgi:hypothetical protein
MKKHDKAFLKVCKSLGIDPESIPPIMSFENACEWLERKPMLPVVLGLPKKHQNYVIADYKLITITEALNMDPKTKTPWEPDWSDSSQNKYQPWFWPKADKKRPSGFGFSGAACDYWRTLTFVGSRLCLKNYDRWKFITKVHEKLFIERTLILK